MPIGNRSKIFEWENTKIYYYSKYPMSDKCKCKDKCEKEGDELSHGEGYLLLKDECGDKYRFHLMTSPDPEILAETIDKLSLQLRTLFLRGMDVTVQDVNNLNIICPWSSVTALPNGLPLPSGVSIGDDSLTVLAGYLNFLKNTVFTNSTISVTSRLMTEDILLLNIVLIVKQNEGFTTTVLTFSGQYHVVDCGKALCVDFLTVNLTSTPLP
jgi:hypothetical protein